MLPVRVRFAPSPSGKLHLGNARTALVNWLFARSRGGALILRIEDSDPQKCEADALASLCRSLRWLDIDWDEGPDCGGGAGPYRQSARGPIYADYIERLKAKGRAYVSQGATWFRVSGEAQTIDDVVQGRVTRREPEDFVIARSSGTPVFHLANVVDDIEMSISHVIRGAEHLSNTSKHLEMYRALGVRPPAFAHIPLLLRSEGAGKLSKRDLSCSIEGFEARGTLPRAIVNYLVMFGLERDMPPICPSLPELIPLFDLSRVGRGNARLDRAQLRDMNARCLGRLSVEELEALIGPRLERHKLPLKERGPGYLRAVLALTRDRLRSAEDAPQALAYFFRDDFPVDSGLRARAYRKGEPGARCGDFLAGLRGVASFEPAALESYVDALSEASGLRTGAYLIAVRLAISGQAGGAPFYEMLSLLGEGVVRRRIERFLAEESRPP